MEDKDRVNNFLRYFEFGGTPRFEYPPLPEGVKPSKLGQNQSEMAQNARIRIPRMEKPHKNRKKENLKIFFDFFQFFKYFD